MVTRCNPTPPPAYLGREPRLIAALGGGALLARGMRAPVNPRMEQPILESKPVPTPTTRLVQGGPPPSLGFMLAINSFAFCYGLVITTLGMIILPIEAVYIFPEAHAVMLAVMLGCTGVAQLISPVTGYLSDRSTSQFGRRRPIMVLGAVIAGVGTLGMSMSHYHQQQVVYVVSLVLTVFGLNCSYSSYTALLPDFIAPEFMGRASGIMACLTTLGSFAGFALLGFLLEATDAYPLYFATIAGSVILTCCIAPEKQLEKALPIKLSELVASYTIDSHAYPDFFWVCVTRTFYYMGISVQAFSLFMLRDVQKVGDPKYWIAIFSMVAQISAGVVAIPSGKLSDRTGRKVRRSSDPIARAATYTFVLGPRSPWSTSRVCSWVVRIWGMQRPPPSRS